MKKHVRFLNARLILLIIFLVAAQHGIAQFPPSVTTLAPLLVGSNIAYPAGLVNANGDSTSASFQYGLTTAYGSSVPAGTITGTSPINITGYISQLIPGHLYHCRAVGTNTGGTTYGNDVPFTTPDTLAGVFTNGASNIGQSTATIHGMVYPNGSTTTISFDYGLTGSYGSTITAIPPFISGDSLYMWAYAVLNGLLPGTTYHYRITGVNSSGPSYGYDSIFTTVSDLVPIVITNPATSITAAGATLNGQINPNGAPTNVTFQYGLTTNYNHTVFFGTVTGNNFVLASVPVTGLSPSTQYHFRAVAVNGYGTTYGNDTVFTTSPEVVAPPTVITAGPYFVIATNAGFKGYVNPNGHPTTVSFQYGLTTAYGSTVNSGTFSGNNMQTVYDQAFSLTPATLYHYRMVGTNAGGTAYGNDTTFTTTDSTWCHAIMSYAPAGSLTMQFHDASTGGAHDQRWHFGDGTSTWDPDPVHTYQTAGDYQVFLRIYGTNPPYCSDSITQWIHVGDTTSPHHHIYGQVFAEGIPIETGVVNLFSVDTIAPYQPYLDISTVDSTGTYNFNNVPAGDYYVNAIPVGVPGYLPTFYGDVLFWEDASIIHLGVPDNPYDINLVGAGSMNPGNGSIGGQLNTSGLKSTFIDKVTMLLMNANGKPISYDCPDSGGSFSFASLAYGTYYLKAEMAGIASELIKVVISLENPDQVVTLTFTGHSISGTKDILPGINSWVVYPNPVTDHVLIGMEMKQEMQVVAQIYNLAGQLMSAKAVVLHVGNNTISLSTATLPAGLYTLRVSSEEGVSVHSKLVKTR
jgi:hypothetical protein